MQNILEVLQDTAIDTLKLLPFLFITYLIMEYIEHKTSNKIRETIKKSGRFGPLFGAVVGIFPQCGFSVSATNLYAARVISLGTLISVYLATSDEMLPILLTESVPIATILTILGIKLFLGIVAGFIIDFVANVIKKEEEEKIEEIKIQNENTKTSSFLEDIKIKENKEFKELLYLQKLFKMGRIKEKDLSKEERIGLEKLYKQQIYDLKKSINGYKNKIISIRTKLAQSN